MAAPKSHSQPDVDRAISRVRAWLSTSELTRAALALEAGVDEKTVRLAPQPNWNPTADTLRKLEALIPTGWQIGEQQPKRRKAA